MRILAADDGPMSRLTMIESLRPHEVFTVETGEQALYELLQSGHRYDVFTTDQDLEEAGGHLKGTEVIRRIRACPFLRTMGIVMVSGNRAACKELEESGDPVPFVHKNDPIEVLLEIVDRFATLH